MVRIPTLRSLSGRGLCALAFGAALFAASGWAVAQSRGCIGGTYDNDTCGCTCAGGQEPVRGPYGDLECPCDPSLPKCEFSERDPQRGCECGRFCRWWEAPCYKQQYYWFDWSRCECACPSGMKELNGGCVCDLSLVCDNPLHTRDPASCRCSCTTPCSGNYTNPQTCKCECPTGDYVQEGNRCVCDSSPCANPRHKRSPSSCACGCDVGDPSRACLGGQWDESECRCVCPNSKEFVNGACECPNDCGNPDVWRRDEACGCNCLLTLYRGHCVHEWCANEKAEDFRDDGTCTIRE